MRMVFVPLFCASVPQQPKSKAFGLEFVNRTVLDKNDMICGERSSCGEEGNAGRVYSADAIEAEMKRDFRI